MKLSMRWLADYYPVKVDIDQYISDLTMSGSKVEGYDTENGKIKNVVVGKVLSVVPHPDADSLVICQIDVAKDGPVQIVTGADNVTPGALIPVALHKSQLADGTKITKGKLRGEVSEGMLCSLSELGLTVGDFPYAIEDGIFLIEEDCQVGDPIDKAIGLDDTTVEFEITSNRPDCMSVTGLARETAATYGDNFALKPVTLKSEGSDVNNHLNVTVDNTELCKRYMAGVIEDVKIEPSPRWLRERLRASGVRPINNIVDITNFVMLETGQPMHAFDLKHVADNKIVVRNAKDGEKIVTLDEEERTLSEEMLVIADGKAPSAVAGVMGGEYSGIYDDTTTIVFESACFDGPSVRKTAKKLGMRTESSGRFEKGLDSRNCQYALERACELVELLNAGNVCKGFIDEDHDNTPANVIPFEPDWTNTFVGVNIPHDEMIEILNRLGFKVENNQITVPSFRAKDVFNKYDIAEEITRIYGYDKIPTTVVKGEAKATVSHEQKFRSSANRLLVAAGYSEILTYSFFSPKNYDKIELPADDKLRESVVIRNPLGEDTSVLRTTAVPSMLMTLAHNYNNRNQSACLFEIASTYIPTTVDSLPNEPKTIILGEYGGDSDFYTLKGGVETLLAGLRITDIEYKPVTDNLTYHPGRCGELFIAGVSAGILGEVHPKVAANYDIGTKAFVAALDYAVIFANTSNEIDLKSIPKFPASTRDLALVCNKSVTVGEIEKIIRKSCGRLLESVVLFDVYEGAQIGEDKKSVAYSLVFRSEDHTLTDDECDSLISKSLTALVEIDVALRS